MLAHRTGEAEHDIYVYVLPASCGVKWWVRLTATSFVYICYRISMKIKQLWAKYINIGVRRYPLGPAR